MKEKTVIFAVNTILAASGIVGMAVFLRGLEWYLQLLVYLVLGVLAVLGFVSYVLASRSLQRVTLVVSATVFAVLACFVGLNLAGLFESMTDMAQIKQLILEGGVWGRAVFVLLQILQVTVIPAPGAIFYVLGTQIYGPAEAFLLSCIGVLIGALIAFSLGKIFGRTVVVWCIGRAATEKYSRLLNDKGKVLFIIMQLLPFFPDDILCMVAGLTSMSYFFFFAVMLVVRPINIALVCYLGTGDVIPFRGWGIPVWIAIFAVIAVLFALYLRNQERVEGWLKRKFSRPRKHRKRTQDIPDGSQ